jgi:hypothetical protein
MAKSQRPVVMDKLSSSDTHWNSRYVWKVREVGTNHQEEYSTWSNLIMAKDKV